MWRHTGKRTLTPISVTTDKSTLKCELKATKLQRNSLKLGQGVNENTRRHGEWFLKALFGFKFKKICMVKTSYMAYIFSILKIITHRESGLPVLQAVS